MTEQHTAPRQVRSAGPTSLLGAPLQVVSVGLGSFAEPFVHYSVPIGQVDWQPPFGGDPEIARLLAELANDRPGTVGGRVTAANATAIERILTAHPVLVGVGTAAKVLTRASGTTAGAPLPERTLLHSGPPIEWTRMCGPMQGAVLGAILLEGWATDLAAAAHLAASGQIHFAPCHHYRAVGPMAGVISPSMPVWLVRNESAGNLAFATFNEGLGKVLRYGANGPEVLTRLRWITRTLAPAIAATIERHGPVDLGALTAQALHMGDECHNRNVAATSLLARTLAPALVRAVSSGVAGEVLDFLLDNNHFYLNLSMAACKATLDAARDVPDSTVVVAMARNGVDFGIQTSGTGDEWFIAPSTVPDALFFPGYGPTDANPDLGDSAITETCGLGGFAMAAAPAIVRFVGGTTRDALGYSREMATITLARNPNYALPPLDFAGTPTGIDVRRVVETRVAPVINTGVAHREPGVGQIGAGITRAPLACFVAALRALGDRIGGVQWSKPR
ncbi:MAG TPA: DUF1116 domain-containing protein [Chloroflexota bacterium]|nr:DUF1116 domain-containing protein [Chloroflexota bacterium]